MTSSLLLMLVGTALLYLGAEALIRGSASLGARAGLTPLVIGLTIVAFGTSMPEMVVSMRAALADHPSIALGNVVGSNIGNVAVVLGLAALFRPLAVQARILRFDLPVMVAASLLVIWLIGDDRLGRTEGVVLVACLIAYVALNLRLARAEPDPVAEEYSRAVPPPTRSLIFDLICVAGGLAMLVLGADLLVDGAIVIAEAVGMSEAVIGLTVVAAGTSLPELATSLVGALKGEDDIAVGNVVGSSIFNLLGILGLSAAVSPLRNAEMTAVDMLMMLGCALALLPLMRSGFRVSRGEGAFLLVAYAVYVSYRLSL